MSRGRGRGRGGGSVPAGEVRVNGYSERWLAQGFPWVYPKEVTGGRLKPGDTVRLRGPSGRVLGHGIADEGWIAVRVFRHDDGPVDPDLIHARLDRAAAHRVRVVGPDTTGYRLVHGENDGLPGVRVDWWDHYAVIVLDSPSLAWLVQPICDWLETHHSPRGVVLCYRPDPRDERDPSTWSPPPGLVRGHAPASDIRVTERGLAFLVRPLDGPDVGLYADMRAVRAFLEPHWGGRRVLNTFAYTGAFSVAAAMYGASEVVTSAMG